MESHLFIIHSFTYFVRAAPVAYGSSQARDRIRAAGLHHSHSHSNTRSKPHLWLKPQLLATLDFFFFFPKPERSSKSLFFVCKQLKTSLGSSLKLSVGKKCLVFLLEGDRVRTRKTLEEGNRNLSSCHSLNWNIGSSMLPCLIFYR